MIPVLVLLLASWLSSLESLMMDPRELIIPRDTNFENCGHMTIQVMHKDDVTRPLRLPRSGNYMPGKILKSDYRTHAQIGVT